MASNPQAATRQGEDEDRARRDADAAADTMARPGPLPDVAPMVHHCCHLFRGKLGAGEARSGLVVGCGSGDEVVYMAGALSATRVIGFDVRCDFSHVARSRQCVFVADATTVPLLPDSLDFAAAFHSLEHVGDPEAALGEIRRVLRPKGWLYVGAPNRTRLVGYVGSFDLSTWQKITGNIKDWAKRLQGRFENRLGAHAGFAGDELIGLLAHRFAGVRLVTEEYLRFKYRGRVPAWTLDLLLSPSLINYTAPAHYAICQKPG